MTKLNFDNFLGEFLEPAKEIQGIDDRKEAREIIAATRGIQPGRYLGPDNKLTTDVQSEGTSLILKNDPNELVLIGTGVDDSLVIRVVNKRRITLRRYEVLARLRPLLKRFL